ncbi:iron complex transport system permease protein [Geodermatophilus tzadiensis]|uniref:Iron complex transport system permease protein n=1 Tax=Geodermatophilus tzadiensis TaxID=1137988 RepID=A0A2T0T6A9_9ACTN|nr:iron ABC transporter permease [Geodermatophilus tzadiensis]PRY41200.1 iron complex transport system permease protein [Geodermatophilus tzadiensis]
MSVPSATRASAATPPVTARDDLAAAPGRAARTRRRLLGLLALVVLLVAACAASIAVGSRPLGLGTVWTALTDRSLRTEEAVIVWDLRVPRTVLGLMVGAALGVSGALIQGHTRNPLGDPGLLGITAGASFAVVLAIVLLGVGTPAGYVWFAFAGALAGTVAVYVLGSAGRGGPTPVTLALAGSALSALLFALVRAVLVSDSDSLDAFRFWVVGALAGRGADVAWQVAPFIAAGLVLALLNAPALDLLGMGEDVARGLGQRVWLARLVGLGATTLLAGAATAACGPIAFVGLVVPHAVRAFTGPAHRWLVPCAGLLGAVVLLAADVLGRVVARPGELQVGIVLALVGGPVFVALVRRRRTAAGL